MNRPAAAAWFAGLAVGAATATAAWVRLAGHPPVAAGAIDRQVEREAAQAYIHMIGVDLSIEERRRRATAAVTRAQPAAIQACIRALEALPTREWDDDEDGTPQRRGQDGPLAPRDPAAGTPGGSEPVRPGESHTGRSGVERTVMTDKVPFVAEIRAEIDRLAAAERTGRSGAVTTREDG